jgi:hypothetical protein
LHDVCQRFWCLVYALYKENPLGVTVGNCAVFEMLDSLACPPLPPPGTTGDAYIAYYRQLQSNFQALLDLMVQYLFDCLCNQLLPPCQPEPADDRLILACLEVQDGKITRISNFCCRRFAGAFPSVNHWLSLFPIIPLLFDVIRELCCDPHIFDFAFDQVNRIDPGGVRLRGFTDNNFARASYVSNTFSSNFSTMLRTPFTTATAAERADRLNLTALRATPAADAEVALRKEGVNVVVRDLAAADAVPAGSEPALVKEGDALLLYRAADGTVAGIRRYDVTAELEERTVELAKVRSEFAALQKDVHELRRALKK